MVQRRSMQQLKRSQMPSRTLQQRCEVIWWKPPNLGMQKINVDASVFPGNQSYSIGMILRDNAGNFCRARTICKNGEIAAFEVEARGC